MNSKETLKQFFFQISISNINGLSLWSFFQSDFRQAYEEELMQEVGVVPQKNTKRGFFHHKIHESNGGWQALGMKPKKLLLAKKQMTEELGSWEFTSDFEADIAKKSEKTKAEQGKVQNKNNHDGCLFLSISSLIHLVQHWHLYKLWCLLPLLQKLAFICCARRNSRTIVVADLKKMCSHSPHKTRLRGLIGNVQRICLSVYMPRNDSGVSQVQEEWWRPRGVKGCFSIGNSTISAMLLCRAGTSCHPFVIVLRFSGYGTSEEGHAKRTGRRGHLMQQKTAGKEFSFGRFWRFWFVWGFVDGFWMFGIVSLRGFKNFVPPRSSRVWFRSHWNIFGSRQRLPVALTNDFSRVKRNLPYGQYGLVKRNTYSSKTICNHV